ncbi:hypothetical protein L2W58_01810 [Dethiosulfovibrio sp. F2B]|uniref:hypothetical protein n=1 Tax=Dethiosulfovibrio faecalis TaxID=2720018 RepID=UPI001F2218B1|nr:hypothetical protein [Dethiosulfovibrio faecalis]MCF4150535.1 hypothetical protein [Dethiosulfovibrio faecalis]
MLIKDKTGEDRNWPGDVRVGRNKNKISPVFVLFLVLAMLLCSSLVCLRMYGLVLESELDELTAKVRDLELQVTSIHKRCLAMESPSSVYGYASTKLGMTEKSYAGIIKVQFSEKTASSISDSEGWRGSLPDKRYK